MCILAISTPKATNKNLKPNKFWVVEINISCVKALDEFNSNSTV